MPSFFPWVLWVRSSKRAVTIFCFALAPFLTSACGEKGGAGQRQGSFAAVDQHNGIVPQLALDLFGKAWVGDPPIDNPTAGSLLSGGRIFIADAGSLSLRIFSEKGDLLKNIGREGGGPGEFQSLPWVRQCAPDSLFVWDPILGRVSVFDADGRYAREFRLPGRPGIVECSTQGVVAMIMQPENLRRPDPNGNAPRFQAPMQLVDTKGATLADLGEVMAFENRPGGKRTRIAVGADRVYIGTQDSAYVQQLGGDGHTLSVLPIGVAGRKTTPESYEYAIGLLARQLVVTSEREAYRQSMLKIPMPAELPPYFELYADTEGTLWAQISIPGDGSTVFARTRADGRSLMQVRLSREIRVFEVGTDYVLGTYEDDSDNPHVVLYRLPDS